MLLLETTCTRLERMSAAEIVNLYIATIDSNSTDSETEDAIFEALHDRNPHAYNAWMNDHSDYNPADPESIKAADKADAESLRKYYGITA